MLLLLLLSRFSRVRLCDPIDGSPPGSPRPWDSPGKNTGVGCHFLLQCRKEKSESEVAQSCPTLHDPMDCSLPGSSVYGSFQARVLEWGAIAFSATEGRDGQTRAEIYMPLLLKDQICLLKDPGSFQFMLPCHFRLALVQVGICSLAAGGSNVEAGGKPRDSCLVR